MEAKQVKGLMEAYASVYTNISESHFKVGDEVICKASGMEGEVVKVDPEETGKYYTVKREDGKMVKYAPDELKLDKEEEEEEEKEEKGEKEEKKDVKEAKNGGASKKSETKFHLNLDKLVHKTFGASPEEKKKMKEEVELDEAKKIAHGTGRKVMPSAEERSKLAKRARAGEDIGKKGKGFKAVAEKAAKQYGSKEAGERVAAAAMFKQQANEEVGTDLFDVILEHLVAEGYADTNEAALAIMANMSEEWRNSILEQMGPTDSMADKQKATWNKGQKLSDPRAQKIYDRMTGPNPVKLPPA